MTENKPTKFYSERQEKYVANQLGWEVVTGSGARDCHPGDVKSDTYLGECKTHTTVKKYILMRRLWWNKIVEEAEARHRIPALFVDNGDLSNIWVLTHKTMYDNSSIIELPPKHILTNISFKADDLDKNQIYSVSAWSKYNNSVLILSLEKFKELIG